MIEQLSNNLMALAFFTDDDGVGVTGLTVTVDAWRVVNNAGTPSATQILTDQSATAVGGGIYGCVLSSSDVGIEGSYIFLFKTASDTVRDKQLPALWTVNVAGVEHLDENVSEAGNNTISLDALSVLTFGDFNLVGHGEMDSEALGAGIFEVEIPRFATHILMQATDEDIIWTEDGSDPTTSHGFVMHATGGLVLRALDAFKVDESFKFLRATSGANLQWRFYRPAR